jgi:hypothetical protein
VNDRVELFPAVNDRIELFLAVDHLAEYILEVVNLTELFLAKPGGVCKAFSTVSTTFPYITHKQSPNFSFQTKLLLAFSEIILNYA